MPDRLICSPRTVKILVQRGGYWTRLDLAREMGRAKTTHVIATIEKAVTMGFINKIAGYDEHGRDAWIYTIESEQKVLGL